jgi:AraC-like DNA-binding protein
MSAQSSLSVLELPQSPFIPSMEEEDVVVLLRQAVACLQNDRATAKTCIDRAAALLGPRTAGEVPRTAFRAPRRGALAPWQENHVVGHVARHLGTSIGVAELASLVGLSTSYFSKAFKASFGMTPHAYVVGRRLQHAKEMMLSTDEPLAQIAIACGLADQSHLSRLFRQEIGVRPRMWRRIHGERSRSAAGLDA